MSQEAVVNQLFAVLDALPDFDAGRVTKRDMTPISPDDPGWRAGKPAAVVWSGAGEESQAEITGDPDDLAGNYSVVIQVAKPYTPAASWPNEWATLQEDVKAALRPATSLGSLSVFNRRIRWGEEPPTWRKNNPNPSGAEWWVIVSVTTL